jgi:hypothetical protein
MKILDLGRFISSLFTELGINIYPCIAENSVLYPYAVYARTDTGHRHKDRQLSEATYTVKIVTEQYEQSVELLQRVIDATRKVYTFQGDRITARIETASEFYSDAFVQQIALKFEFL